MRLLRLGGNLKKKLADPGVGVVVFEAARHAKGAGALVVQSELQGVIKLWCEEEGIPYCGYSPTSIKKHATGRGNASKDEMLAAAREKWPDKRIADDNEADALWLLNLVSTDLVIAQ